MVTSRTLLTQIMRCDEADPPGACCKTLALAERLSRVPGALCGSTANGELSPIKLRPVLLISMPGATKG
ncbi:MAG: hypothetical protein BWZ07_03295 [Alphaproteobacteria bacterium ADurb.BinA280]|nr:MAG: hypothetical protein BWZ07_03295 [Alphaproteobacteria bacterium ADurb.BinA280]